MQQATILPGHDLLLGYFGDLQGVIGHHGGVTLQMPVQLCDAVEKGLGKFYGRELSRFDQRSQLTDRLIVQCGIWHNRTPSTHPLLDVFSWHVPLS
jgi:hypothetical protein